jgi:hypothetical protein
MRGLHQSNEVWLAATTFVSCIIVVSPIVPHVRSVTISLTRQGPPVSTAGRLNVLQPRLAPLAARQPETHGEEIICDAR